MADLFAILSTASSSLAAQRALTATISHNIDNAGNASYSRQIATLSAVVPAEQAGASYLGRGSTLDAVTQARDKFLEAQLPRAFSDAASSTAQSDALQAFHDLDPDAAGGVGASIGNFYSAMTSLAQNPSDGGLRTTFLGAAQTLAQSFNRTYQDLEASRSGLDQQVAGLVTQINSEAEAVAQLNRQIAEASAAGGSPNDLLDLRQKHLDQLATLAGATAVPSRNNEVQVVLPGGLALVSGQSAASLATSPDPANQGHLALTLVGIDGSSTALPGTAIGGSAGGTLLARDGNLASSEAEIDTLAFDLAGAVNAVHQGGYGLDGSTGLPLFDVGAGAAGAAGRMTVAIADQRQLATAGSPNAPGDATNVNAMLATSEQALSSGKNAQATYADMVSEFGAAQQTAQAFAEQDAAVKSHLSSLRASVSGVSTDQELIDLQQAQRGYEAIARIITVADSMFETLMNIK